MFCFLQLKQTACKRLSDSGKTHCVNVIHRHVKYSWHNPVFAEGMDRCQTYIQAAAQEKKKKNNFCTLSTPLAITFNERMFWCSDLYQVILKEDGGDYLK